MSNIINGNILKKIFITTAIFLLMFFCGLLILSQGHIIGFIKAVEKGKKPESVFIFYSEATQAINSGGFIGTVQEIRDNYIVVLTSDNEKIKHVFYSDINFDSIVTYEEFINAKSISQSTQDAIKRARKLIKPGVYIVFSRNYGDFGEIVIRTDVTSN